MGKNQNGILPILGEAFALYPYNWLKDMHLDSTRGLGLFANWAILLGSIFLFVTHGSTLLTLGLLPTWARFNLTQLFLGDGSSLLLPRWAKRFWQQYEGGSSATEWTQSGVAPPLIPCASTKIPIPINTNAKTNVKKYYL